MFNLLIASDDSDWNVAVGINHEARFLLSRYLEYTDTTVEEKLKPISPASLAFLAQIPAVFLSEIRSQPGKTQESLTIRVGRVQNIRIAQSEILYEFRIDQDFGDFPVWDRRKFEQALELGRWELSRTHWAVKQGDLTQALMLAGVGASLGTPVRTFQTPSSSPPNEPRQSTAVVSSLEEYLAQVQALNPADDEEVFYRGHSDSRYRLEPTLFRRNGRGEFRYLQKESTLVREILAAQASEFASDQYMLDRLVRMQHYGLPTRLLDVTSNPLVALYFCCSTSKYAEGIEVDGEVVVLTAKANSLLFFDSDTVSCVANLCLMSEMEQKALDTTEENGRFNKSASCQKLLHFIRREKPYFEARIDPQDLNRILFVRGRNTHERIISQSGAFVLFGKDAVLPETGHSSLDLHRITIRNKAAILEQLARINIKSSTVFPGIEKATAEIAKKYELI